jgi:glycosyltransferase involved in cell wall biosynthesis
MRGDLVNELFDRVPVIIAPLAGCQHAEYGWWKIQMPSNYQKFHFSEGNGLTVWVRCDQEDVIQALGGTPFFEEPERKNLRIFFPGMHHTLIKSMVLTCQHLGHTLILPGDSFDPERADPGPKLQGSLYYSRKRLQNDPFYSDLLPYLDDESLPPVLEIMENDAFLEHPPDILVVNWEGVESGIYHLHEQLQKWTGDTGVKIVHYAGNNNTLYQKEAVKNLIAVDAYTAKNHDPFTTNIIFWIPWLDAENLAWQGYGDNLNINNFLDRYYQGPFKKSFSIFQVVEEFVQQKFPEAVIHSPLFCPPHEVFSFIDKSCATLHIKETEGFGYTIVESMAMGRPVFLYRPFSLGSRLMNWSIEGKTAFFFHTLAELEEKLRSYLEDEEYRHQVQEECARTIRRLISNEKQARILDQFLQNLI